MDLDICMDFHHIHLDGLINKVKQHGLNYILKQNKVLKI